MRRPSTLTLALTVLVSSLALAGCKKSDTVLLIEVWAAAEDILPYQFNVTVSAGFDTRAIPVPAMLDPANAISLPTSFTISLDRSHTGPITVTVDAFDEKGFGSTIAAGTTTQQHPVIGGQTVIAVRLSPVLDPTNRDGGAGGAGGMGGGGGMGGAGAGGQAGGAGQDAGDSGDAADADASDAARDARDDADGMGLDTGTD